MSIKDFERMQDINSTKNLLYLTYQVRDLLKDEDLPADLSSKLDYYTWEE